MFNTLVPKEKGKSDDPALCRQLCEGDGNLTVSETVKCAHFSSLRDGLNDTQSGWDEDPQVSRNSRFRW